MTKYRKPDHYTEKAKKQGYPARSVYKLEEIQNKYKIMRKGNKVLDLGCFPGSWLLYASEQVGKKGQVVGIDIKDIVIRLPENVLTYNFDMLTNDDEVLSSIGNNFNLVLSDMAPSTSGNQYVDAQRSYELSRSALKIAKKLLRKKGHFVCKIFQGEDSMEFSNEAKKIFKTVKIFKPKACLKSSKEIYITAFDRLLRND